MRGKRVNFGISVPMETGAGGRAGRLSRPDPSAAASVRHAALRRRHGGALARYATELFDGDAGRAAAVLEAAWPELAELRRDDGGEPAVEDLFALVRRQALAAQRGGGAVGVAEETVSGGAADAEPVESPEATVARVFARLTPKQQEALRLKFGHGFRHAQSAVVLGLPASQAAQLVHNALGRVERVLRVRRGEAEPSGPDDPRLTLAALDELNPDEVGALAALMPDAAAREKRRAELRAVARLVAGVVTRGPPRLARRSHRPAVFIGVLLLLGVAAGALLLRPRAGGSMEASFGAEPAAGAERVAVRRGDHDAPAGARAAGGAEAWSAASSGGAAASRPSRAEPVAPAVGGGQLGAVGAAGPAATPRGSLGPVGAEAAAAEAIVPAAAAAAAPSSAGATVPADAETGVPGPAPRPADIAPIVALRRALQAARWPDREEVDAEAWQRHFAAAGREATEDPSLAVRVEAAELSWRPGEAVARAAVTAPVRGVAVRPPVNLVLLLDVSGSMDAPNRLPLVQEAVLGLLAQLQPRDRVALVTYAGEAQVWLPLGEHTELGRLREGVLALEARGRTNGGAGLAQAFALTAADAGEGREAIVVLCTDGEFNLGQTSEAELGALVAAHRARGGRLAIFGFGRHGAIDPRLEALAALAGGGSGYVNTRADAVAVLARQLDPLFAPVARAVELRLGAARAEREALWPGETLAVLSPGGAGGSLRHRDGAGAAGLERTLAVPAVRDLAATSVDYRFAVLVEELTAVLRAGPEAAGRLDELERQAGAVLPEDRGGYRRELLALIAQARAAATTAGR